MFRSPVPVLYFALLSIAIGKIGLSYGFIKVTPYVLTEFSSQVREQMVL